MQSQKAEEEARLAREEAERQAAARAAEEARKAREAEAARAAAEQEAARKAAEKQEVKKSGAGSSAGSSSGSSAGSSSGGSAGSGSGSSAGAKCADGFLNGQAVVDYARQFLGNPYVYGGNSLTNGTDCSGFVKGRVCGIWNQSAAHIVGTAECGICRQPVGNPAGRHCLL